MFVRLIGSLTVPELLTGDMLLQYAFGSEELPVYPESCRKLYVGSVLHSERGGMQVD